METIVFERRNNVAESALACSNQQEKKCVKDDTVTIDSHIELKVSGALPEMKILNGAEEFMEKRMASFLTDQYEAFKSPGHALMEGVLNFDAGETHSPAFEQLTRMHQEKGSAIADLNKRARKKSKFLFSVEPGFDFIIPPYDNEWSNRFASFSCANKVAGTTKSFPANNAYCASGAGIFLSPTADIVARFNAHFPVSYSWMNFVSEGGGYSASQGGLGITLYNATWGTLVSDDHTILWNQSKKLSDGEISGGSDDLYLQQKPLGQRCFEMNAGDTYLVWLWCWSFADSGPNAAAYANIDCKVPFMIVDSSTR